MRFAERLGGHASEATLAAIVAGGPSTPHVASCAPCQARLAELRAWVDGAAADAGAMADAVFTPERLAAQKDSVLARLEAAGRSARVIAFPAGAAAPAHRVTADVIRWAAAAAVAFFIIGLASGRLLDPHTAPSQQARSAPTAPRTAGAPEGGAAVLSAADLDEAALLDAAYDRVSLDSLRTIDDMTPRARELTLAAMPRR